MAEFVQRHAPGQNNAEPVEERCLADIRLSDAAQADLTMCSGGQDDVAGLNTRQFFENSARGVAEAGALLPQFQAFP